MKSEELNAQHGVEQVLAAAPYGDNGDAEGGGGLLQRDVVEERRPRRGGASSPG